MVRHCGLTMTIRLGPVLTNLLIIAVRPNRSARLVNLVSARGPHTSSQLVDLLVSPIRGISSVLNCPVLLTSPRVVVALQFSPVSSAATTVA